jgi:hypothetical protein
VHGVQIGVVYPQIELGGDPTAVRQFGRAVEELGFDYLLAYDHVLGAVHGAEHRGLWADEPRFRFTSLTRS